MTILAWLEFFIKASIFMTCLTLPNWPLRLIFTSGYFILLYLNYRYLRWLEVKKYQIKNPELAGLKILHISDIHNSPNSKAIQRICQAERPDLILDTGDTIDELSSPGDLWHIIAFYKSLPAPIFRIDGNHEKGTKLNRKFRVMCKRIGVTQLTSLTQFKIGKHKLTLSSKLSDSADITLVHNPAEVDVSPVRAKLVLAGHTHGGLIRPFGQIIMPVNRITGLKYPSGKFNLGSGKQLIVSKGIGFSTPKFRLHCRPDVNIIQFIP